MKPTHLEFSFDGPSAADAQALANFLAAEFPDWQRGSPTPPPSVPGTREAGLVVEILTLLAALPVGWNHTRELAKHHQLGEKFERLIAWAKERRARRERNPFIAVPPRGNLVPLDQVRPEQLLEAVTTSPTKPPPKS